MLIAPDVFRKSVRGYRPRPEGASFRGVEEVEILGSEDGQFRPGDAELGPDGALYILDWRTDSGGASQLAGDGVSGRIYRPTWGGTTADPPCPTFPADRSASIGSEPDAALFDRLAGDEPMARAAATREVARRMATPGPSARAIWDRATAWISDDARPTPARVALLNVAGGAGPERGSTAIDPTRFEDPTLRRAGYAAVRLGGSAASRPILTAMLKANETDPSVVREQALALARVGTEHPGGESAIVRKRTALLGATRLGDGFARDCVVRALEAMGTEGRDQVVRMIGDGNRTTSRLGRYALQAWRGEDAVSDILAAATSAQDMPPTDRANLFLALREHSATVPPDPVARWLADQPRADLAPRVEAVRLLAAFGERAQRVIEPIIVTLLDDPDPPVRLAAIAPAAATLIGCSPQSPRRRDDQSPDPRIRARRVAGRTPGPSRPIPRSAARRSAPRQIRRTDHPGRGSANPGGDRPPRSDGPSPRSAPNEDENLRAKAIAVLGQKPASALELVRTLAAGTIPPRNRPG